MRRALLVLLLLAVLAPQGRRESPPRRSTPHSESRPTAVARTPKKSRPIAPRLPLHEIDTDELRPFDAPDQAAEYFKLKRVPDGQVEIPTERYIKAKQDASALPIYST